MNDSFISVVIITSYLELLPYRIMNNSYAVILCLNSGIETLVLSAYLEALAFLPLDKHLGRDTLAIYRKACGFIPEQCDDVYGSILDASDFLYKALSNEQ